MRSGAVSDVSPGGKKERVAGGMGLLRLVPQAFCETKGLVGLVIYAGCGQRLPWSGDRHGVSTGPYGGGVARGGTDPGGSRIAVEAWVAGVEGLESGPSRACRGDV